MIGYDEELRAKVGCRRKYSWVVAAFERAFGDNRVWIQLRGDDEIKGCSVEFEYAPGHRKLFLLEDQNRQFIFEKTPEKEKRVASVVDRFLKMGVKLAINQAVEAGSKALREQLEPHWPFHGGVKLNFYAGKYVNSNVEYTTKPVRA